jgi:hypothetical protein
MENGEVTVADADDIRRRASEVGLGMDLEDERRAAQAEKP